MYNVVDIDIGRKIKEYRKLKSYTLQDIGDKICKSKATILKYENGDIIPDIITLLEICNALGIRIQEVIHYNNINTSNNYLDKSVINLFKTDKLYLYYLIGDKLISSILEFDFENRFVRMCNSYKSDMKKYAYHYEGNMEFDNSTMYINCTGIYNERVLEKVQIIFKMRILNDIDNTFCFITSLTHSGIPVIKKGIIKAKPIQDYEKKNI